MRVYSDGTFAYRRLIDGFGRGIRCVKKAYPLLYCAIFSDTEGIVVEMNQNTFVISQFFRFSHTLDFPIVEYGGQLIGAQDNNKLLLGLSNASYLRFLGVDMSSGTGGTLSWV